MHWVKNPSAIDLDLLFQPRIPDSCILEPEIVASLFKTGSGKNAGDTYFSTLCPPQSISQCEPSVANAFPFGQIEALGIFKTHTHEGQASFAYEPHTQPQLQSIKSFPCLVVGDGFGAGDARRQMQREFSVLQNERISSPAAPPLPEHLCAVTLPSAKPSRLCLP
jgi:hypothetical protein